MGNLFLPDGQGLKRRVKANVGKRAPSHSIVEIWIDSFSQRQLGNINFLNGEQGRKKVGEGRETRREQEDNKGSNVNRLHFSPFIRPYFIIFHFTINLNLSWN